MKKQEKRKKVVYERRIQGITGEMVDAWKKEEWGPKTRPNMISFFQWLIKELTKLSRN